MYAFQNFLSQKSLKCWPCSGPSSGLLGRVLWSRSRERLPLCSRWFRSWRIASIASAAAFAGVALLCFTPQNIPGLTFYPLYKRNEREAGVWFAPYLKYLILLCCNHFLWVLQQRISPWKSTWGNVGLISHVALVFGQLWPGRQLLWRWKARGPQGTTPWGRICSWHLASPRLLLGRATLQNKGRAQKEFFEFRGKTCLRLEAMFYCWTLLFFFSSPPSNERPTDRIRAIYHTAEAFMKIKIFLF